MEKVKTGPFIPLPVVPTVLVGANVGGKPNYLAVGFVGGVNIHPPIIGVSLNKRHYTVRGILENGTFSVNIPSARHMRETDYCGLVSGRSVDKSAIFSTFYGELETAPMIEEFPIVCECRWTGQKVDFQMDTLYFGDVVQAYVDRDLYKKGKPADILKIDPLLTGLDRQYRHVGEAAGRAFRIGWEYAVKAGAPNSDDAGQGNSSSSGGKGDGCAGPETASAGPGASGAGGPSGSQAGFRCEIVDRPARPTLFIRLGAQGSGAPEKEGLPGSAVPGKAEIPGRPGAAERRAGSGAPERLASAFGEISHYLEELGIAPADGPFVSTDDRQGPDGEIRAGFLLESPARGRGRGIGRIEAGKLSGGLYAECLYTGSYEKADRARAALRAWIGKSGFKETGPAYEFYRNDPAVTPPDRLETLISVPVRRAAQ